MRLLSRYVSTGVVLGLCGTVSGTVLRVPSEYPTIQAGIDGAVDGDTVLVADGIYTGDGNRDIDFHGKAILLISEHGPEVTIIDCEGNSLDPHRGFHFHSGEESTSVVQGFRIQNGYASAGGGIRCTGSRPTIAENVILGGGASWAGGAIRSDGGASPTIVGNRIFGNSDTAISLYSSSPTIAGNLIADNSGVAGAAILCDWSSPTISGNTITGNTSTWAGAGIVCINESHPVVVNSVLWDDSAGTGPEIFLDPYTSITVSYSDVQGGSSMVHVEPWATLHWGVGNIDTDPLFVTGPLGDCYLSQIAAGQAEQSPCVDAGDPGSSIPEGTTRTDEEPDVSPVDMGYHYPIGGVGVSREEKEESPELARHLAQSYPNPFSSTTTIAYSLPASSTVHLAVYDVRGALVRTLTSGMVPSGRHEVMWDGRDERGREVGSGVYFCRLEAGDYAETRRMVLLR